MTNTLHAHVMTASRDCDGGHGNEFISEMTEEEIAHHVEADGVNDFSDLIFKGRILSHHVSFHSEFGVTVKVDDNGFSSHEATDEGYRGSEVRWCEDDCVMGEASQYDQFAEMMGY